MRIDNPLFNPIDISATSSHAVSASYALTASISLDSAPPVIISGAAPSNAKTGDLWFDSVKGDTFVYYSASTWVPATDNVISALSSSYATTAAYVTTAATASYVNTLNQNVIITGSLGIGTASPTTKLDINGDAKVGGYFSLAATSDYTGILGFNRDGLTGAILNSSYGAQQIHTYQGDLQILQYSALGNPSGVTAFTNTGNVGIGTSSPTGKLNITGFGFGVSYGLVMDPDNDTSGGHYITFRNTTGGVAGSIVRSTGNAVTYNTTSDYRLKENVKPLNTGIETVMQLKPSTYDWKSDGSSDMGFIAHELQEHLPNAVLGEKDGEEMQGVDYSKLIPVLTAAIQQQQQMIEELKAEIQALKSK